MYIVVCGALVEEIREHGRKPEDCLVFGPMALQEAHEYIALTGCKHDLVIPVELPLSTLDTRKNANVKVGRRDD